MMKLHRKCTYDVSTRIGRLMPIVIYFRGTYPPTAYRITEHDFQRFERGKGKCYGRSFDGVWCWLTVFDYSVIGVCPVTDSEVVRLLEEELYS